MSLLYEIPLPSKLIVPVAVSLPLVIPETPLPPEPPPSIVMVPLAASLVIVIPPVPVKVKAPVKEFNDCTLKPPPGTNAMMSPIV